MGTASHYKNYLQKIRLLLYIPTAMSFLLHCFRLVILFNIIENILIIYKRHGCNKDENPMTCCGQPGQVTTRRAWRSSSKNISKAQSESSLYHTFQLPTSHSCFKTVLTIANRDAPYDDFAGHPTDQISDDFENRIFGLEEI